MATYELREAVNITSQFVPPEVDEAALAGLEMVGSRLVKPLRVAASPVHLECKFHSSTALPARKLDSVHQELPQRTIPCTQRKLDAAVTYFPLPCSSHHLTLGLHDEAQGGPRLFHGGPRILRWLK